MPGSGSTHPQDSNVNALFSFLVFRARDAADLRRCRVRCHIRSRLEQASVPSLAAQAIRAHAVVLGPNELVMAARRLLMSESESMAEAM